MDATSAIEIRAPVRGETANGAPRWVHVVFAPGRDANEQIEIADDRLAFDRPPSRSLYELKQQFSGAAEFRLSRAELAAFKRGCPRARIDDGGDPDVRVLLGTREQRSWQLAYALSCLVSAGVGRWRADVRYVATGQLHDGRIRADLLADKLALAGASPGRVVFLAPFDPGDAPRPAAGGGPDATGRRSIVRVSGIAELWEDEGSPLAAHADLEAVTANLRRSLAPREHDVELGVRLGARDRPAIAAVQTSDAPLILRGGSGAGKTSLLGRLAIDAAADPARYGVELALPPIALRRFTVQPAHGIAPLLGCIGEVLFEHGAYQAPPRAEQVRALLCSHRALLLFDGLNEVPEANRGALALALDGLLTLCPDQRYVMTDDRSPWFKTARWRTGEVLPMTDAQVHALLEARPEAAASRLLARPDLRALLRIPLLAVLLAESTEPSGGLGTLEQVIHGFVQGRFERWASEHALTRHGAAVVELIDAARRLADRLGARAFTAEEAARILARPAPWPHDPVSALIACGLLIDGPGGHTLEFRHDTLRCYFQAGAAAARLIRGRLAVKRDALVAPSNEVWLRHVAVQLAPAPARRVIAGVARESPALAARLADTLSDDRELDAALASIARSARLMRRLSRRPLRTIAVLGLCHVSFMSALLLQRGLDLSPAVVLPATVLAAILLLWPWYRFTRAAGEDDAALRRLLTITLELRPGSRVRAVLETIVRDTARSPWVRGALRGHAIVLQSELRAPDRGAIDLLEDAARRGTLASGILALEHLADPRVAAILAHLIARGDLYSAAAATATRARVERFPHDEFWLAGGANPRHLAHGFAPGQIWERGFGVSVLTCALVSWLLGGWGLLVLCWALPALIVIVDITRAGARPAFGADTWSGHAPWGYALGALLPPPFSVSAFLGVYLPRRQRILRTARGFDWQKLAGDVAAAESLARAGSSPEMRTALSPHTRPPPP